MKPKYKWLRATNVINDYKDESYVVDNEDKYVSWLEELPIGWYVAFGEQMVDELNLILEKGNFVDDYKILQIKEKFGGLRWYDGGVPSEIYVEFETCLDKYETLSKKTCISCGLPATHMTKGWALPLCDECGRPKF